MTRRRLKSTVGLSCFVVILAAVSAPAKDRWINLATKNFNVISNADEGATHKLALKLEEFHFAFSKIFNLPLERAIKTTVIVFRNEGSFTPYKPVYNGKPANVAGYFQGGEDENLIVMDISANQDRPMSVIYHEYTHLLTSNTPRDWPVWLKEGLAELYSSFDVFNGMVLLAAPISRHVALLRQKTFISLKDLLSVGHGSPLYNERDRQGVFYAESWALCHYMMIGDSNAREAQMVEYTTLINQGVASDEAFSRAFKSGTAEVEKLLKNYISRNTYSANTYKRPTIESEKELAASLMSEAEVQYYLGDLLARTNRIDEAEVLLKRAIEMDPQLAGPYEGLGFVAVRRNRFAEALEFFKKAAALGSKNHLAHYYYADALLRQVIGSVRPPVSRQIADELRTSIKLMPGFAFAHYALANLALMTEENLKEGLEAATIAIKLEPQNKRFALALAQLQMYTQDYAAAKDTLERLLSADLDPKLKESAEATMKSLVDRARPARVEQTLPEQSSGPPKVGPESKAAEPAKSAPEPPQTETSRPRVSQPTIKLEGTQTVRGVLLAIECRAGKWTLVVKANDSRMRFMVSDKDKLEFFSQDPSFTGAVRCGPINKTAFIYFKPAAGRTTVAGDAVAVEFTRD
jgi:tetratricopeptide (TPR) repeat protein